MQARADEFNNVGSINALKLALDTIVVQSNFQGFKAPYQRDRLAHLEARWNKMGWDATSDIAERFAKAYAAAADLPGAIRWYEAGITASDGDIPFRILEQVSNLRVRHAAAW